MGHPNEPHDNDRQPTDGLTHPLDTAPPPPAGRSHTWFGGSRRTAIVAGVAGLVIGGVVGGSIGWAATGNDDQGRSSTAYSRQLHSADGGQKHHGGQNAAQRRARGVTIGTITAENGSTWTVAARTGSSVTVTVGPNTRFGTAKKPQQRSDFVVGDRIAVVGKKGGGTVIATRVVERRAAKTGESGAPPSAAPSTATQPG